MVKKQIGTLIGRGWLLVLVVQLAAYSEGDSQADASLEIPELAIMDIEPSNTSISLGVSSPLEAGEGLRITEAGTDDSKWLNYSSSLASNATSRSISVQVSSGSIPTGLDLCLEASAYTGNGDGETGYPTGKLILSKTPQVLLSGIGGCYTGDGTYNGHQLTYSIQFNDQYDFDFSLASTIEVTFTITD